MPARLLPKIVIPAGCGRYLSEKYQKGLDSGQQPAGMTENGVVICILIPTSQSSSEMVPGPDDNE